MLIRCVTTVALILLLALRSQAVAATSQPNILFLVADDLGWGDVGYHGSPIQTPNIDSLCRSGVELNRHYVQPMCTPTRVALLTGHYPSRYGDAAIKPSNERVLPWGTETLASLLARIGYDTGLSGKWHLGSKPEWGPNQFGFRRSYGSLAGGCGQFNHLYKRGPYSQTWHRDEQLIHEAGHTTDLIAREVVHWIEQRRTPWFYYVPFTAVHVPVEVHQEHLRLYDGQAYDEDPQRDLSFRRYAAYTTHMDEAIGRLVEAVERTGQRESTLIVFTSDNGSFPSWKNGSYPGTFPPCPRLGSNLPLRGYKAQLYEGAIRTPTCISWPGELKPGKVDAVMHIVDWMPTLARLCGSQPAADLMWDGQDIWPLLTREVEDAPPRTLYWKFVRGQRALLHGNWKLIDHGGDRIELFDLANDPHEQQDLTDEQPQIVQQLQQKMERLAERDRAHRPPDRK